jgi:uncharacterized protein (DUF4213/DUF364 family)
MPDQTERILEAILETLPKQENWQVDLLYIGVNWTISIIRNPAGEKWAGLAASPSFELVTNHLALRPGPNRVEPGNALKVAHWATSTDQVQAASGLATINALLRPDPALLEEVDAADWLVQHGRGRKVAMVGRFPFAAEELRPVVEKLWIFELQPQPGEYSGEEAPQILPHADILAITSSTLVNHTLGGFLSLVQPHTKVILLGPTTPLTPVLFQYGVDLLSGVQVADLSALLASIEEGVSFRKVAGLRRVTLRKDFAATLN